ncbi:hypothetical protein [Micromonospora sp. NPDC023956]|uniref:hypothetical protein n=1 Tax=Micromonospora sp. NPDC023956 TaxID=3155722 RepID=UPI0033E43752
MTVDAPTQQHTAVPAPVVGPAPAGHTPYIGRHRANKHEARHTRHLITNPVHPGWWPAHTPRRRDVDTALMPPGPDSRGDVLAEMRADLEVTP